MSESKKIFLTQLGGQIRKKRIEKGISQAELARKIYKDKQSLERVENGKTNPSIYYLLEVARGLDLSLNELLSEF
ncbi:MAG: transcriptional regulator [Flavobacteriales bacterium]|nr:MAG: transcriptional regulator [Flavobacteriales bacterium]